MFFEIRHNEECGAVQIIKSKYGLSLVGTGDMIC